MTSHTIAVSARPRASLSTVLGGPPEYVWRCSCGVSGLPMNLELSARYYGTMHRLETSNKLRRAERFAMKNTR